MHVIRGLIDRRILVNFRVEPDVLAELLPAPFRPKLVGGNGMAGVCLIRLKNIRPRYFPSFLGISSENAAHRIAVEWDQDGESKEGVFIPRRDTSSRINTLIGGSWFPGVHHHAAFDVEERNDRYRIELNSDDRKTHLLVDGRVAQELPKTSVFDSIEQASGFFERGSLGFSATARSGQFDGLELRSFNWQVQPLVVDRSNRAFLKIGFSSRQGRLILIRPC